MKKVLVTGGNGFIGSHLIERLVRSQIKVKCLIRKNSNRKWLNGLDIEYIIGDLFNHDMLHYAVKNIDVIFHLAAITKSLTKNGYYEINTNGTENILNAVIKVNPKIKKFVFVSSLAASGPSTDGKPLIESDYPNPVTLYGKSKLAGEKRVMAFSSTVPVTIIRPPIVFGPRDRDGFEFFKIINRGIQPFLGWRDRYGSFIYVDDLVEAMLLGAEKKEATGQTFFFVTEAKVSWACFGKQIAKVLNKKIIKLHIPVSIFILIIIINEIISKITGKPSIINLSKLKDYTEPYWLCRSEKAERLLGFKPKVTMEEGINASISWYKQEGWL
jgi:nucleoside-diphosphate-sugar epimerase